MIIRELENGLKLEILESVKRVLQTNKKGYLCVLIVNCYSFLTATPNEFLNSQDAMTMIPELQNHRPGYWNGDPKYPFSIHNVASWFYNENYKPRIEILEKVIEEIKSKQ